jgi:hypothetical protein
MNKLILTLAILGPLTLSAALAPAGEEAPKKKAKSDVAVFTLADGSQIAGKVAFKQVTIVTAYGKLVVPLSDVIRMRIGRGSDKKASARIDALIKKLGSADFDERQKATEALTELGHEALEQLEKATKSDDAEIKTRAEKLIGEIEKLPAPGEDEDEEEGEGPLMGTDDELVTSKFTALGKVQIEKFEVTTQYGKLSVPRDQVVKAIFTQPDGVRKKFKLGGDKGTRSPLGTRIRLKRGDKVKITASGSIRFTSYNRDVTPQGETRYFGNTNNCPGMSLIYKISGSNTWLPAGKSKTFKADKKGELIIAVNHTNSSSSSSARFTGGWKVKIEVTPKQ